jgi:hypothetical protein
MSYPQGFDNDEIDIFVDWNDCLVENFVENTILMV